MDIKELYWAAGFLEGEGSFYSSCQGYGTKVDAYQVDTESLHRLVGLFGGAIRGPRVRGPARKPIYYWRVFGPRAAGVMMTLYSLMSVKRKAQIHPVLSRFKLTRRGKKLKFLDG